MPRINSVRLLKGLMKGANYSQSAVFYSSTVPCHSLVNALIYAVVAGFVLYACFGDLTSLLVKLVTFNYVNQYTKPFNDISSVLSELQSSFACAERLYSVLDQALRSKRRGTGSGKSGCQRCDWF